MSEYICFECGYADDHNYQVCPNCNHNSNKPNVVVTDGLLVKHISDQKGRGVVATKKFYYGDMIESCPVIIVPSEQAYLMVENTLWHYMFPWKVYDGAIGDRAIAMGYGMLYNHHHDPNAMYRFNDNSSLPSIDFFAKKDINVGDEITIDYGDNLWFPYFKE
jgi:SET domain-containing protein